MGKRIEWIDTAKGIGLILVILGHLHIPFMTTWIYLFHMPLFFFLSGLVYSGGKYTWKQYLIKKAKSLLVPYVTYGFIILLFYTIVNSIIGVENSLYGSTREMFKNLIIQEHFWTIWFLTALFLVEIIYYFLNKICSANYKKLTAISILMCAIGLMRYRLGFGSLPWNLDIAFVAQLFFHVGRIMKSSKILKTITAPSNVRKNVLYTNVFLMVNVISGVMGIKLTHESLDMSVGLYGNEILTFISAFSGIFFVISLSNLTQPLAVQYLGRNTMLIFALHSRVIIVGCSYIYEVLGVFQGIGYAEQILSAIVTFVIIIIMLSYDVTLDTRKTFARLAFSLNSFA